MKREFNEINIGQADWGHLPRIIFTRNIFRRDGGRCSEKALLPSRGAIRARGMSLVETVLALGVLAFAIVPLIGLLPIGMATFRKAIDASVTTQIAQQIVTQVQQGDLDSLSDVPSSVRYFNRDGEEVSSVGSGSDVQTGAVYHARVAVTVAPTLPGASAFNENLATVTVQIANNPGNLMLPVDDSSHLWSASSNPSVSMTSYSTILARNYSAASH